MTASTRTILHDAIDQLPEDALPELADYVQFLQWKAQAAHFDDDRSLLRQPAQRDVQAKVENTPPYNPVDFSAGILKEFDFSPEYIRQARRELWGRLGRDEDEGIRS